MYWTNQLASNTTTYSWQDRNNQTNPLHCDYILMEGYYLQADIVELKMYQQQQPFPIDVQLTDQHRKNQS